MRRITLTALITAGVLLLPAAPGASAAKSCGTTSMSFGTGKPYKVTVKVHRGTIACKTARSIVRRGFFGSRGYPGWRCFEARPATTYDIACAPNGQDPDRASRVVRAVTKR